MTIAILAPSDKSYIGKFLPEHTVDELPEGYLGAPWIGAIIEELINANHKVIAITTTKLQNEDFEAKVFTHENFTWGVVPMRRYAFRPANNKAGRMLDFFAHERKQMLKIIHDHKPDIVHGFWSYEFAGAAVMSKVPCLVTIEDNAYKILRYFKHPYRLLRLFMSEWVLHKVRFASTVSPYMLNYAKNRCGSVKVIPNPVPITSRLSEVEVLIENRIRTISSPKILMINNGWDHRKNGKCGLIAYEQLLKIFPGASLHLYGNGSGFGGKAYHDAQSINLQGVNFHGIVSHEFLVEELKTAHLLMHPALEESFGVVLIEAMSFGVPAIGGINSGGVPWVINNKDLLIDVSEPVEIKDKMKMLLQDIAFYKQISYKCYKSTEARFSANHVADDYLEYYNEILKEW